MKYKWSNRTLGLPEKYVLPRKHIHLKSDQQKADSVNDTCQTSNIQSSQRHDGPFRYSNKQQTLLMGCYYYG